MSKSILAFLFIAITISSCALKSKNQVQVTDEDGYYEGDEAPYWNGPGLYWGVYINNENQYWNHHNQRYPNRRGGPGAPGGRGGDGGDGGGHGGGGHR